MIKQQVNQFFVACFGRIQAGNPMMESQDMLVYNLAGSGGGHLIFSNYFS